MKKVLSILFILTIFLSFSSCSTNSSSNLSKNKNIKNVTTEEAHELLASTKNLVVLDVRTKSEFDGGHIKGAISMPDTELDLNIDQIMKFRDNPVLVYCRTGRRSKGAVDILSKYGFKNVFHMYQGVAAWKYDLEK